MSPGPSRPRTRLLARGSWGEASRIADVLRRETVGGLLLLAASVAALVWATRPRGLRTALSDRVSIGIRVGLVAGKAVGVFLGTFLVARLSRAELDDDLSGWTCSVCR
jgi:Na+/H+ antiporter NhaA